MNHNLRTVLFSCVRYWSITFVASAVALTCGVQPAHAYSLGGSDFDTLIGEIQPTPFPDKELEASDSDWKLVRRTISRDEEFAVKLELLKEIAKKEELPFELRRWATMRVILSTNAINDVETLFRWADEWLAKYPDGREDCSDEWKRIRPEDKAVSIYLRGFLGDMILTTRNEARDWTPEERLELFRKYVGGAFEVPATDTVAMARLSLTWSRGMRQLHKEAAVAKFDTLKTEEEHDAYRPIYYGRGIIAEDEISPVLIKVREAMVVRIAELESSEERESKTRLRRLRELQEIVEKEIAASAAHREQAEFLVESETSAQ